MKKNFIIVSLFAISLLTTACSDNETMDSKRETNAISVKKTPDMVEFENSFRINTLKLQNGEINESQLNKLIVESAKNYLSINGKTVDNMPDDKIIIQALDLNLERNKTLYNNQNY